MGPLPVRPGVPRARCVVHATCASLRTRLTVDSNADLTAWVGRMTEIEVAEHVVSTRDTIAPVERGPRAAVEMDVLGCWAAVAAQSLGSALGVRVRGEARLVPKRRHLVGGGGGAGG